jgi:hypothetical protein
MAATSKPVNLSDRQYTYVYFARFCQRANLEAADGARLIKLCQKANNAGVHCANTGSEISSARAERARRRVVEFLNGLPGHQFSTLLWGSFWPSLVVGDDKLTIPEI